MRSGPRAATPPGAGVRGWRAPSCYSPRVTPTEAKADGPLERGSAMLSAKAPPVPSGYLRLWVRSVEGPMLALDLPATDHRIVIGKDRDFLISV
jgi:hypothetical protein